MLGNYYYSPLGLYGWLGLYAMSVMTTRVIWLVGNVCLVGNYPGLGVIWLVKNDQGLGIISLVGNHQDP